MGKEEFFSPGEYIYDEYYDYIIIIFLAKFFKAICKHRAVDLTFS